MTRATVIPTKICDWCGKSFLKDPRYSSRYFERQRFCCQQCSGNEWKFRSVVFRAEESHAFAKYVGPANERGCTEWLGARDKDGYGVFGYAGVMYRAHRASLRLSGVTVPRGMMVCHHCDNPACVNPQHLYVGTALDNMRDAKERNRIRAGTRNHNAKLTEADITIIRASSLSDADLAERYEVTRSNISMIRTRRTWKHVA